MSKFRNLPGWGNPGERARRDQEAAEIVAAVKTIIARAIELRPDLASLDDDGLLQLAYEVITRD